MKYVLIDEETLKDNRISREHTLSSDEIQIILVHRELISKFILQRGYSIQTELGHGEWEGRESIGYEVMKQLSQIAKDIKETEELFKTYQAEITKKEEENSL